MSLNISFAGKTILITGGGQGIGRQLVQRFYDGGATVCTLDKNPATIENLRNDLPNVKAEIVDLSDWDATRKAVESFGTIDYAINSAGVIITEELLNIKKESAALQINVNLLAAVNVTQCVAKGMVERGSGGSILNVSSGAAKRVGAQTAIYSATKAAIENLTKTMAVELAPHNIRVNCMCPGGVDTPMLTSVPTQKDECLQRHLIKRLVDANELADLAIFLLSPSASMITGESAAKRVGAQTAIYSATKAAIENLTKTMAVELAPHNIRVNCMCPGGVDTPMLTSVPTQKDECLQRHLIKRLVDANELADLAIFLLSPSASMITGESVVIDGGYTIT